MTKTIGYLLVNEVIQQSVMDDGRHRKWTDNVTKVLSHWAMDNRQPIKAYAMLSNGECIMVGETHTNSGGAITIESHDPEFIEYIQAFIERMNNELGYLTIDC